MSAKTVSPSSVDVARDLVVMVERLRRRMREVALADQLSPSQVSVLARLSKGGPSSTSGLAAAEGVRPQSMAATVAPLFERGLIERSPDPEDGRRQLITLTKLGHERSADYRAARREWLVQTLETSYTEKERAVLVRALTLLERITEA
jgi:DNA-binding MarR family transcriptional regulator